MIGPNTVLTSLISLMSELFDVLNCVEFTGTHKYLVIMRA